MKEEFGTKDYDEMTFNDRETLISFDEIEKTAEIYTSASRVWRRLETQGLIAAKTTNDLQGNITSKTFYVPRWSIKVKVDNKTNNIGGSKPADKSKPKTEAQIKNGERLAKLSKAKRGV